MSSHADHNAQQAPEVMENSYPEPLSYHQIQQQQQYQYNHYPQHPPVPPPKNETGTYNSNGSLTAPSSAYPASQISPPAQYAHPVVPGASDDMDGQKTRHQRGGIFGCTLTVFVLSAIIAFLLMAVIALAAGTGVEASRASTAQNQVNELYASISALSSGLATPTSSGTTATSVSATASSTSTSFASIDDNCSGDPGGVTGTTYAAFSLIGDYSFTIKCNSDAVGTPLMNLFTANLETCMDACASYTQELPTVFPNNTNTTCGGVSFIPLWTNKTAALDGGAPGNCYLKPTQTASPNTPNIGTECHAGILVSG
ncbi:hypothetical protein BD289DRAFT_255898 [Coniella lustricola]|uniref:Uncharacterized protein n=1 Tax=Coniella lustricola TaxID=2025994 RepID=A0A2T3AKW5_9PEZI|nr:hypothetical protein BD289DRAFT_255898 [Coniella lustricola]